MAEELVTNVSFMALNYGDDIARGEHTSQLLECPLHLMVCLVMPQECHLSPWNITNKRVDELTTRHLTEETINNSQKYINYKSGRIKKLFRTKS